MNKDVDVFVVGGGPAGLGAGIAAAQLGLSVMVADAARPPIDKACGEGIMPDGVLALRAIGVDLAGLTVAPFEGVRFVDAAGEIHARFPKGVGLGMRRSVLHSVLAERADSAGVRLAWGTRVTAVRQGEVDAGGRTIKSRFVVCADGLNSSLRQMAGLSAGKVYRLRYGFQTHYQTKPWSPFVEVHWANCGQIYVTPVGAAEICVVFITSDKHIRLNDALPQFPELRERLAGQTMSDRAVGGLTVTRKLKTVTNGRVALVGDSSGSADAITGDGLSMAFQQAAALADAMRSGDLNEYRLKHREISRLPRNMGKLMLVMHDYPWVRRKMFLGFSQSPPMFERLLAMHTRAISPMQLGVKDYLAFGLGVLRA